MKRSLFFLAGMVFILAFGMAYAADDVIQWNYDKVDKMILDQDLQKYNQDREVTRIPAEPGAGGSAAGGSGEPILKEDSSEKPAQAPVENMTPDPYDRSGGGMDDPYRVFEKHDQDTYRY
jgi:hypothetical protein